MKDMAMKLRNGRKLTPDDVRQIRSQYQPYVCTQKTLAETYGVSIKLIQDILNNKIWQYV
jgi:DNA-binding transcriptional regulator YiaG